MNQLAITFAIVLLFTLIGGFFAASETALVSLRESQVHRLAQADPRRGPRLRRLIDNPNRFLAAVQVGVTIAGFVSAGFGASQVVPILGPWLSGLGVPRSFSDLLALILSTLVIAFISLVLGELVPKRLALQKSEAVALVVAGPIDVIANIARPFIWALSASTNLLVRALGLDPATGRESMTGEELRGIVAAHSELSEQERALIDEVFGAGETQLREVMIPRTEVEFLSASLPAFRAAAIVSKLPHSRYPIIGDSRDDVLGFVHVRDILSPDVVSRSIRLEDLAREVAFFPGSLQVIPALAEMRRGRHHLAVVADEYGGTAGIVTMEDLVEELVGDIRDEFDTAAVLAAAHDGIAFQVEGLLNLEDFAAEAGFDLPEGPYETVAGWFVAVLGRLPVVGDRVVFGAFAVSVLSLDGRRIERLEVAPLPAVSALDADTSHEQGPGEASVSGAPN